jgi:hypothetical protein
MRNTHTIRLPDHHECPGNFTFPGDSLCDGYFVTCAECTWTPVHGPVEHQEILATLAQGALGC